MSLRFFVLKRVAANEFQRYLNQQYDTNYLGNQKQFYENPQTTLADIASIVELP